MRTIKSRVSILGAMSEKDKAAFLQLGKKTVFKEKTCIFLQGDKGTHLYAIQSGHVAITTLSGDGKEVIVQILHPGDVFGEIAMFDQRERTNGAHAEKGTVLIAVEGEKFINFLDRRPHLYRTIINLLCQRLRWSSRLIDSFAFDGSMERLVTRLAYLAEYHGHRKNAVVETSQDALAKMLGLSREAVNRNLRELQKRGLLTVGRKKVLIPDVDKLTARHKRKAH